MSLDQVDLFGDALPPAPAPAAGPIQTIYVHFEDLREIEPFGRLIGMPVTTQTRFIRFPVGAEYFAHWRASVPAPLVVDDNEDEDTEPVDRATGNLFGDGEWWEEYWRGMPEFVQENLAPRHSIQVEFARREDVDAFGKLVGQTITPTGKRTRCVWYPEAEIGRFAGKAYVAADVNPRYPVYIISKGRWETRLTADSLERMGVPYHIVVEPQEQAAYAARMDPAKILALPFSNLGQGSIPARNWVWEHAAATGARRHWILDDNVDGFYRLNRNLKVPCSTGAIFRAAEDFSDRFENVAISGFHYFMFASRKAKLPPFTLNTRVYSMILIRNDLPHRWRGRYNEDTDLSIRALKDGLCTVLFTAFLGMKTTTMTMRGGNTEELYAGTNAGAKENDGRWKMAESLRLQHPELVKITWKWGRWQHHVDYSGFRKNRLIPRPGLIVPGGVDDFGMSLRVTAPSAPRPQPPPPALPAPPARILYDVPEPTVDADHAAVLAALNYPRTIYDIAAIAGLDYPVAAKRTAELYFAGKLRPTGEVIRGPEGDLDCLVWRRSDRRHEMKGGRHEAQA